MSHLVTIQTQVKDIAAIRQACERLQLATPREGSARIYNQECSGWLVELPEWRFPVVCQTNTGELQYDNFGGRWGDPQKLDAFLQHYAVAKATLEAHRQGHSVQELLEQNGAIRLTIGLPA
jgi:hypothetical protein